MAYLSQNKKIAIAAVAIFIVSFSVMLFFLEKGWDSPDHGQVNVLHGSEGHGESTSVSVDDANVESGFVGIFGDREGPVFLTNPEGRILYANEDFCELLGVYCDGIKKNSWFDYVNSKDFVVIMAAHTQLIQNGEKIDAIGPVRMSNNDKSLLVLLNAEPVPDKNEKVEYIIFSVKDLTEQVENLQKEEGDFDYPWLHNLQPSIRETEGGEEHRFMVEKIGYLAE